MKTTIYMVTMTSYTTSDNNLYNNTWTYNNEEEARQQYISLRDEQSEECRWGADYDNDDHTDDCEYNMSEREDGDTYEASSEAYEGYRVQIKLEAVEVDIPVYAVTFTSHARTDWDEHLHTEAPGLFQSKEEAAAAFEGNKNYARATASNEYEDSEYCPHVTPDESDEDEGDCRYYTATRCQGDEPKDYYIGRVELHTL